MSEPQLQQEEPEFQEFSMSDPGEEHEHVVIRRSSRPHSGGFVVKVDHRLGRWRFLSLVTGGPIIIYPGDVWRPLIAAEREEMADGLEG